MSDKSVTGIECRFALLSPVKSNNGDEIHIIKEQISYSDGTKEPNLRIIRNFKRPFWVTNQKYRNHKDKKEWEGISKLEKYECLQSELAEKAVRALGSGNTNLPLKQVANSPYLYGTDIKSTATIKQMYKDKYPNTQTFYSVCSLDIESSMVDNDIILITICQNNNVFTSIYAPFIDGIQNFDEILSSKIKLYLSDFIDLNEYKFEHYITKNQVEVITSIFDKLHEWKPDFLSIWNMDYDINEISRVLEKYGVDPKDVFSDPSVPYENRYYIYKQGKKQKITSSGKYSPISPANQWHSLFTPSSFYVIDAMCTYRKNRLSKPEEQSYSLDSILNKELGLRKLKFEEAKDFSGGEWHEFMQSEYPVEYIVYNIFDSISMMELEKKTKDLAVSLPLFCGISDFSDYESQPKRLSDRFHFLCLENNLVVGSTGRNMKTDFDDETLPLKGWIVNLPAHLITNDGLCNILEDDKLKTNIRIHTHDLDIRGAYPTAQIISNVSKETTKTELVQISGIDSYVSRMENINLFSGHVNALEYCQTMFNFPQLNEMLNEFVKYKLK